MRLVDILRIDEGDFGEYKVHFAQGNTSENECKNKIMEIVQSGNFEDYQNEQTKQNFSRRFILSLVAMGGDKWLFMGVWEVLGKPEYDGQNWRYTTRQTSLGADIACRAIIADPREVGGARHQSYPYLENVANMEMVELLAERVEADFDGFDKVNVSFDLLESIIQRGLESWQAALGSVSGVYLITDSTTGKQYVGSAYDSEGIWGRWCDYIKTGHGGNAELKELLENDKEHKRKFKFSVLEIHGINTNMEYIIGRENYWKSVLMTREFGLNKN